MTDTRTTFTMMAAGTLNRKRISRERLDDKERYPNTAVSIINDIIDRNPLHACTTSRVWPGKKSTFPSRKIGTPKENEMAALI